MPRALAWVFVFLFLLLATPLALAETQLVWPLPPQEPKIEFVQAFSTSKDIGMEETSFWQRLIVGEEPPRVSLVKPYGIATDSQGRIYVTDTGTPRVAVFDLTNKEAWYLGNEGRGQLGLPIGIAIDPQDRVYVSDALQRQILVYGSDGTVLNSIGNPTVLTNPTGIALDWPRGYLYVADSKEHQVKVFALKTGEVVRTIGGPGVSPGRFNAPTNLFVDGKGQLYVTDTLNFRIQVFDPAGKLLYEFGQAGDTTGTFARPKGVAVDSEGHIYVIDAAFNNFQIFNQAKELLLFVGTGGIDRGQFRLPAGIHIDQNDLIYVVDQLNARIQIFRFLAGD